MDETKKAKIEEPKDESTGSLIQWHDLKNILEDREFNRIFGAGAPPSSYVDETISSEEAAGGLGLLTFCATHQDQMQPINNKAREAIVAALKAATFDPQKLVVFEYKPAGGGKIEIAYLRLGEAFDEMEYFFLATSQTTTASPYLMVGLEGAHPSLATRDFIYENSDGSGPGSLLVKQRGYDADGGEDNEEDQEEEAGDLKHPADKVDITPQHLIDCASHYYRAFTSDQYH